MSESTSTNGTAFDGDEAEAARITADHINQLFDRLEDAVKEAEAARVPDRHMIITHNNGRSTHVLLQSWSIGIDNGVELLTVSPPAGPDTANLRRLSFPVSNIRHFRIEDY